MKTTGNYDPKFWLDYFKRTHSDGACLAGGGYMAFYPTEVPLHSKSKFLGDRDPTDWISVDAQGKKRRHCANPALWVTCALGPMNLEFMTEVTREIVAMYGVDGVFINRWTGSGQCFCEHCQRNFKAASGLELPRASDPRDPARRAYIIWHEQQLFEVWNLWDAEIRKINPNARFIPNSGGGSTNELDMRIVGEKADILFADRKFNGKPYDHRWLKPVEQLYTWHWKNEKYLRNEESLGRVAIVFSQQPSKFYGGAEARTKVEDPTGASIRSAQLLVSAAQPTPRTRGRDIEMDLPPIGMHEVVAIDR